VLAPLPQSNSPRDFLVFEEHLRNVGRTIGRSDQLRPEWYNLPARGEKLSGRPTPLPRGGTSREATCPY